MENELRKSLAEAGRILAEQPGGWEIMLAVIAGEIKEQIKNCTNDNLLVKGIMWHDMLVKYELKRDK